MKKRLQTLLALCLLLGFTALNAQQIFTDNYANGVTFVAFGGSTNAVTVDNSQFRSGSASLKIVVPAAGYTGGAFKADTARNLTTFNAVSFWAKASAAKTLNVAGLGNNGSTTTYQTEWNAIAIGTDWKKYIIPIPNAARLTAEEGLFHFAEGSDEGAYTLWIDDVQYENITGGVIGTVTAAIATETINTAAGSTFNINGTSMTVPVSGTNQTLSVARAYFTYTSSNPSVATVSATGQGSALAAGTANITARLGTVNATGTVTVNVTAASVPTASAPVPTRPAANVISLFSNAYTNVPVDTWSASWDQADVANYVIGTNDTTKRYTNLTFAGVEFTSRVVNATNMTHFHVDIWTPDATIFKIKLVDFGANGTFGGGDDTEHELSFDANTTPAITRSNWIGFDIPLSSFTGLRARANLAQMIFVSGGTNTVYVDNVYFYNSTVQTPVPTASAPVPTRPAANVISLFSNAYTNVPVDTWSASWDQADVANYVIGTTDTTKRYTNLTFAGVEFTSRVVNATNMTHFHVDIWTPDATIFKIKLVDFGANGTFGGGDDSEHELSYDATTTPAITRTNWIGFDIPLSSFTGLRARANLAQMIFVSGGTNTVYVDNVYFYRTTTSTRDLSVNDNLFKAYPSVSNGTVTVEMTEKSGEKAALRLTNASGALVQSTIFDVNATQTVDTRALPAGMYFLSVQTDKAIQTRKIIVP